MPCAPKHVCNDILFKLIAAVGLGGFLMHLGVNMIAFEFFGAFQSSSLPEFPLWVFDSFLWIFWTFGLILFVPHIVKHTRCVLLAIAGLCIFGVTPFAVLVYGLKTGESGLAVGGASFLVGLFFIGIYLLCNRNKKCCS